MDKWIKILADNCEYHTPMTPIGHTMELFMMVSHRNITGMGESWHFFMITEKDKQKDIPVYWKYIGQNNGDM